MRLLTKEEKRNFERCLNECKEKDTEAGHGQADDILCDILTKMGYKKIVKLFNDLDKWYA